MFPCAQLRPSRGAQSCGYCVETRTCGWRVCKPHVLLERLYFKYYAGLRFSWPWIQLALDSVDEPNVLGGGLQKARRSGRGSWELPIKSLEDGVPNTRGCEVVIEETEDRASS
jgi:hypothetical protein